MNKKGHMHFVIYYFKNIANDVINVSLFAGPVYCEPHYRRVEALKADILNITYDCYSQNNNVEMAAL